MTAGVVAAHYVATATTYDAAILADSPQMFLKLDETSGATTAVDSSGNGHNMPASNVTWGQPSLLTDGSGTSAAFNGTSALLSLASATWMDSSNITYEARIKWDGTQQWIGGRWTGGSTHPWLFQVDSSGHLEFFTDNVPRLTGSSTLVSGSTYTVACRANGTTLQVFVNGVSDGSVALAGPTQTGATFEIARAALVLYSTLRIDGVAFWTSAISDARLAAHHAAA